MVRVMRQAVRVGQAEHVRAIVVGRGQGGANGDRQARRVDRNFSSGSESEIVFVFSKNNTISL